MLIIIDIKISTEICERSSSYQLVLVVRKCSKDTNTCFMVSVWYILKLLLTSVSVKEVDIHFPFSNIIIVNND